MTGKDKKQEEGIKNQQTFGFIAGGFFMLIAVFPWLFHHGPVRLWAVMVSLLSVLIASFFPRLLKRPYQAGMFLGNVLGWVNTRIILGLFFYLILTPIALIKRLTSRDPMARKYEPKASTYKITAKPRDPKHMEQQF